jgi:hypothetical protein
MTWQGNGMGAAWARHAMCESAFTVAQDSKHYWGVVKTEMNPEVQ